MPCSRACSRPNLWQCQPDSPAFNVTAAFMQLAKVVGCHRDVRRWDLLYQLLFRLAHEEKNLLRIGTDPLTHALHIMQQSVRRDAHKMKAFVRFRRVEEEGQEHYIAFHEPDHYVVPLIAPFFMRRFAPMVWTILTPDISVHWDLQSLTYGPGVNAADAPQADQLEGLWRDYYRATFNPARIKINMMKREMPVRYWKHMPETTMIAKMLAEAPARERAMLAHSEGSTRSAADYLPAEQDIATLRAAARGCAGCELHQQATQTVFGEGPTDARIMLVGEQPGNEEDIHGKPFVGPAGKLLDGVLDQVGLQRSDLYITNAVKHFRFLYKDSFRQHQSPSRYHVQACKPWLTAEIASVKPALIVCLGNTAARALINPNFVMKQGRGILHNDTPPRFATYHPSAILRLSGKEQAIAKQHLVDDLKSATTFAT